MDKINDFAICPAVRLKALLVHEMPLRVDTHNLESEAVFALLSGMVAEQGLSLAPVAGEGKADVLVATVPACTQGATSLLSSLDEREPAVIILRAERNEVLCSGLEGELLGRGYLVIVGGACSPKVLVSQGVAQDDPLGALEMQDYFRGLPAIEASDLYEYLSLRLGQAPSILDLIAAICSGLVGRLLYEYDAGAPYELASHFPLLGAPVQQAASAAVGL